MEVREIELVCVADDGHDKKTAAVLALHVDGQAEIARLVDADSLIALAPERCSHHRHLMRRERERKTDEVGERDLFGAAGGAQCVIEVAAPHLERVDGDRAEARRGRDRQALFHVVDERSQPGL